MRKVLHFPQNLYAATAALWAIGLVSHCAWRTYSVLSGPPSPDLYANHISFQLVSFLLFFAPLWLLGLLLILIGEFAIFGRKPNSSSKRTRVPRAT
jgi:hypothetical protein